MRKQHKTCSICLKVSAECLAFLPECENGSIPVVQVILRVRGRGNFQLIEDNDGMWSDERVEPLEPGALIDPKNAVFPLPKVGHGHR